MCGSKFRRRAGAEEAPDTKQAIEAINAQVAAVEALSTHARATAVKAQMLADTAREKAIEFHKRLVAFRRVLASVVGQRSRDYQLLRYRRARQLDEGTDVIIDDSSVTEPSTPAAEVTSITTRNGASVLAPGEVAAE